MMIAIGPSGDLLCSFIQRAQSGKFHTGQIDESRRITPAWQEKVTLPGLDSEMVCPLAGVLQ